MVVEVPGTGAACTSDRKSDGVLFWRRFQMTRSFFSRHAWGLAFAGLLILLAIGLYQKCEAESFEPSSDPDFISGVSSRASFPFTPLGACYDGTRALGRYYGDLPLMYAMDPGDEDWRGHVWLLVGDGSGGWTAIDSYYGPMASPEYYDPPIAVSDFDELAAYIPTVAC